MKSGLALCCLTGCVLSATALLAQDGRGTRPTYARGAHAYFAGDYLRAEAELTQALGAGSTDPRCFYFRALTYWQTGRQDEAKADMALGAQMENADSGRYPVGRSLERIQGESRRVLERYRRQARVMARQGQHARRQQRSQALGRTDERVLRRPVIVLMERLSEPTDSKAVIVVAKPKGEDPFTPVAAATPDASSSSADLPYPDRHGDTSSGIAEASPAESAPSESAVSESALPKSALPKSALSGPKKRVKASILGRALTRILGRTLPKLEVQTPAVQIPTLGAQTEPQEGDPFGTPMPEMFPEVTPAEGPAKAERLPTDTPTEEEPDPFGPEQRK